MSDPLDQDTRARLPNRRQARTTTLSFVGQQFGIGIGFYPDGNPGEVFARSTKPGSQLDCLLDDVGTVVSIALQCGISPLQLGKSLGRGGQGGPRSSVLGVIVDLLAEQEMEARP